MRTDQNVVFDLWCRLTGQEPGEFGPGERAAFDARPQIAQLSAVPYPTLLDAGVTSASRGSLPLERWLAAVRSLQAVAGGSDLSPDSGGQVRSVTRDSDWSWPGLDR
jgi:hypothetical protein